MLLKRALLQFVLWFRVWLVGCLLDGQETPVSADAFPSPGMSLCARALRRARSEESVVLSFTNKKKKMSFPVRSLTVVLCKTIRIGKSL